MTVEELKATAKDMGYKLMPIAPYEKLKVCTCGCKRRKRWYISGKRDGIKLVCCKCGKEAFGETEAEARRKWNRMIERERT